MALLISRGPASYITCLLYYVVNNDPLYGTVPFDFDEALVALF